MESIKFNPDLESEGGKLYRQYCEEKGIDYSITAGANFCLGYMAVKPNQGPVWVKASDFKYEIGMPYHAKDSSFKGAGHFNSNGAFIWGDCTVTHPKDQDELYILDESATGREDWINVDERPLIKRDGEWWELTEDGEKEFIAAVPYHDAETDDPKKDRWWIRHCYIDGEGFLYVKCDNEMDEDVAGWNVSDITHWRPLPEPPKRNQQKEK